MRARIWTGPVLVFWGTIILHSKEENVDSSWRCALSAFPAFSFLHQGHLQPWCHLVTAESQRFGSYSVCHQRKGCSCSRNSVMLPFLFKYWWERSERHREQGLQAPVDSTGPIFPRLESLKRETKTSIIIEQEEWQAAVETIIPWLFQGMSKLICSYFLPTNLCWSFEVAYEYQWSLSSSPVFTDMQTPKLTRQYQPFVGTLQWCYYHPAFTQEPQYRPEQTTWAPIAWALKNFRLKQAMIQIKFHRHPWQQTHC